MRLPFGVHVSRLSHGNDIVAWRAPDPGYKLCPHCGERIMGRSRLNRWRQHRDKKPTQLQVLTEPTMWQRGRGDWPDWWRLAPWRTGPIYRWWALGPIEIRLAHQMPDGRAAAKRVPR